ncbi:MAG: hypothetical protein VW715_07360 [Rhodospirillales bacterium]
MNKISTPKMTGILVRNVDGKTRGIWPESSLPEEALNWARIYLGSTTQGIDEIPLSLWRVGEYFIYTQA